MTEAKENVIPLNRQDRRNIEGIHDKVRKAAERVTRLKEQRKHINDQIAEERSQMETLGIPKAAFDSALSWVDKDPARRIAHDNGYQTVREALGKPVDLFTPVDERDSDENVSRETGDQEPDNSAPNEPDDAGDSEPPTEKEMAEGEAVFAQSEAISG